MTTHLLHKKIGGLCTGLALLVFSAGANAFADDDARRAILDLREQIKQITQSNQQAQIQLADQLEHLRQEVVQLRGELERVRWAADLEQGKTPGQAHTSVQVDNPREQRSYDSAMNAFRQGKYPEAAAGFGTFLDEYPNSQLSSDARFYMGSSLYATKKFSDSIKQLQALVQADPGNARAADALLIVSASQIELDNLKGAQSTLKKIVSDYPDSSAAQTAKSRLELL